MIDRMRLSALKGSSVQRAPRAHAEELEDAIRRRLYGERQHVERVLRHRTTTPVGASANPREPARR